MAELEDWLTKGLDLIQSYERFIESVRTRYVVEQEGFAEQLARCEAASNELLKRPASQTRTDMLVFNDLMAGFCRNGYAYASNMIEPLEGFRKSLEGLNRVREITGGLKQDFPDEYLRFLNGEKIDGWEMPSG